MVLVNGISYVLMFAHFLNGLYTKHASVLVTLFRKTNHVVSLIMIRPKTGMNAFMPFIVGEKRWMTLLRIRRSGDNVITFLMY